MNVVQWLLLLALYVAYLIVGGVIFHYTECPEELENAKRLWEDERELALDLLMLKEELHENYSHVMESVLQRVINKDFDYLDATTNKTVCKKWNYENSLFFAFTVVTTIGYGHQSTHTPEGRMTCLAYAIIGIPLNAILIGSLGSVFSSKFKQYKKKLWAGLGHGDNVGKKSKVVVVVVESIVFIFFFTSLLMLIPAAIFTAMENDEEGSWDYLNSVYYTFITLSTVGFGDMVPDRQENSKLSSPVAQWAYLIGIILWIIIGMGYIFAVVDVLADSFRSTSKPMKKAIRSLRNQMSNDHWKNIINEIILIKESDIKIDDSDILEGGGGSEPNLVGIDNNNLDIKDEMYDVRKTVSTSNIQEKLATSFEEELEQQPKLSRSNQEIAKKSSSRSSIKISENFLTVPGGHQRTRASGTGSDESVEELNDDTITSLRQFIQVAKISQPVEEWAQNNLPGWGGASGTGALHNTMHMGDSVESVNSTLHGKAASLSAEPMTRNKTERRLSVKSNMSRVSTRSAAVGALLEQTTLGEFLTAVENVRRKSQMELNVTVGDLETGSRKTSRRPSFMNRFVNVSRKSSASSDVPGVQHSHPTLSATTSLSTDSTNLQVVENQDAQLINK